MDNRRRKTAAELLYGRHRQPEYIALLLCLAVLVTAGIGAVFHITAIAKTYQTVLTCSAEPESGPGYADFFVHTHSEDCWDEFGNLACELPEIEEHIHGEGCYTTTSELVCTTPESDGHHHTEACYTEVRGDLICGQEESEGVHTHTDACYAVEKKLSCGMEEGEGAHRHTDSCFRTVTTLTCEEPEIILHTHTDDCFREDGDGNRILICEQLEVREHVHGPECFTVYELDDGEPEEEATEEATPEEEIPEETTPDEPSVTETEPAEDAAPQDETTLPDETPLPTTETDPGEAPAPETEAEDTDTEPEPGEETTPDENAESEEEAAGDSTPEQRPVSYTRRIGGEYKGATVLVEVPEGGLDENAGLNLENADEAAVRAAILALVNANAAEGEEREITSLFAIDIGFAAGGVPAEPSGDAPLRITLRAKEIRGMTAPKLFHVKDGSAERLTDAVFDTEAGAVTFTAGDFSPFVIAELTGEDPESEKETAEETAGDSMPEQIFDGATDDIEVHVTAPEGAFPAGTTMTVTAVMDDETLSALAGAVDGKVMNVQAVDIVFKNAAGEQIEPLVPIQVSMKAAIINEGDDVALVHLPEAQNTEAAAEAEETPNPTAEAPMAPAAQIVEAERVPSETNPETVKDEIRFESDAFSIYGLVSVSIEKNILASNGQNYKITVTWNDDAGIPENADLKVTEILPTEGETDETSAYEEYLAKTAEALGWESAAAQYARFFDITIVGEDGGKVQPAEGSTVNVKIELADKDSSDAAAANTQVVHFADGAETPDVIQNVQIEGETVSFQAESFSAYAIVEGPEAGSSNWGWKIITDINEFEEHIASGLYVGHSDGYYFTNETYNVNNSSRTGIKKTKSDGKSDVPTDSAVLYFFEKDDPSGKYYAYCNKNNERLYVKQSGNSLSLVNSKTDATSFEIALNNENVFKVFTVKANGFYWNEQGDANGDGFAAYNANNNGSKINFWYYLSTDEDPYELDGRSFGLMSWSDGVSGKAMNASNAEAGENALDAEALTVMVKREGKDVKRLFASNTNDATKWTFEWSADDKYYISASVNGETQYLSVTAEGVSMSDTKDASCLIQVMPGTGANAGKICLKSGNTTLTYNPSSDGSVSCFGIGGAPGSEWLYLVEESELPNDYFMVHTAKKVSVSDTEQVKTGSKVILYARVWDDNDKKYYNYAIDHDGNPVQVFESGNTIQWIGPQLNTLLWDFTVYYDEKTSLPSRYYELQNEYSGKYLAPQVSGGQVLSETPVGINLPGRDDEMYYSPVVAWDGPNYSFAGLKVEQDAQTGDYTGFSCTLNDIMPFYFAMIDEPPADDMLHEVQTLDNDDYGVTMKMVNFGGDMATAGSTDTTKAQQDVLADDRGWKDNQARIPYQGLLSTDLKNNGYPTATKTNKSLELLFENAIEVNKLFNESVHRETGYFEYDSSKNFASLNGGNEFTVYRELGTTDNGNKATLKHGQFYPYNTISAGRFASTNGENLYPTNVIPSSGVKDQLPDTDPRKYEKLYLVNENGPDYYFGMELEATFVQTPNGKDAWGHDIIFEFTGDDDFWFYVDDELVIDLGGIHSALSGSVNFATGQVNVNGTPTTLYELFYNNYLNRDNHTADDAQAYVESIFEQNSQGQYVFKDYTSHSMKMFFMERGAGASNLKMRFNLSAVKQGVVELTKKLTGTDNSMAEFPYQVFYTENEGDSGPYTQLVPENGNIKYKDSTKSVTPRTLTIEGKPYSNVFMLKPDQTVEITLPETAKSYRVVECGVDTDVYNTVKVNNTEITGTLISQDPNSQRKDFSVTYGRNVNTVTYDNEIKQNALRDLTIEKVLYNEDGSERIHYDDDSTLFNFRLYLGTEYGEVALTDKQVYCVLDNTGKYCQWNVENQRFEARDLSYDGHPYNNLTEDEKSIVTFNTSINGAISHIPVDYTVVIPNILAGTKFKVEERDNEIPDGYSLQEFVLFDDKPDDPESATGTPFNESAQGTVVSHHNPHVEVHNLKGWGLRVNKIWTDKDYMSDRAPTYFAVFIDENDNNGNGNGQGNITLVDDTVRQLPYSADPQTLYWYFPQLEPGKSIEDYIIREVRLTGEGWNTQEDGIVTGAGQGNVHPIKHGNELTLSGKQIGEAEPSHFDYTVLYEKGETTDNSNVRVDTVTNSRPGIEITKTDKDGNPLPGAKFSFTLNDSSGTTLGPFTSDETGMVTVAYLRRDIEYTLTETKSPQNYKGLAPMTICWQNNGTVTINGSDGSTDAKGNYTLEQATGQKDSPSLTLINRSYTFKAVKKDANTEQLLSGAVFELHREVTTGSTTTIDTDPMTEYENLTTNAQGEITTELNDLPPGTYELREKQAPNGYKPLQGPEGYIRFTISDIGEITLVDGHHPAGVTLTCELDDEGILNYILTIPNEHVEDFTFHKIWVPTGNSMEQLPWQNDITVHLYDNSNSKIAKYIIGMEENVLTVESVSEVHGQEAPEIKVNEPVANDYSFTIKDLAAENTYYVVEDKMDTYLTRYGTMGDGGVTVTPGASRATDATNYIINRNTGGYELPSTGGIGTRLFTAIGAMLTMTAGAVLTIRRKRACTS